MIIPFVDHPPFAYFFLHIPLLSGAPSKGEQLQNVEVKFRPNHMINLVTNKYEYHSSK